MSHPSNRAVVEAAAAKEGETISDHIAHAYAKTASAVSKNTREVVATDKKEVISSTAGADQLKASLTSSPLVRPSTIKVTVKSKRTPRSENSVQSPATPPRKPTYPTRQRSPLAPANTTPAFIKGPTTPPRKKLGANREPEFYEKCNPPLLDMMLYGKIKPNRVVLLNPSVRKIRPITGEIRIVKPRASTV